MESQLSINKQDLDCLKSLKSNKQFHKHSSKIVEDCLTILSSSGSKIQNFNYLHINPDHQNDQESEKFPLASQLPQIYQALLTLISSIIKNNYLLKQIINIFSRDLGIKSKQSLEAIAQAFQLFYAKSSVVSKPFDQQTIQQKKAQSIKGSIRKHPLNQAIHNELQGVNFAKIVDISWKVLHCVSYRDLNRVAEPIFQLKLTLLCSPLDEGNCYSVSDAFNSLGTNYLKNIEFECSREDVLHITKELGSALRVCENFIK